MPRLSRDVPGSMFMAMTGDHARFRAAGASAPSVLNAAAELAESGIPAAEAARVLACGYGCRCGRPAAMSMLPPRGRVRAPEATVVSTVKRPGGAGGRCPRACPGRPGAPFRPWWRRRWRYSWPGAAGPHPRG